MKLSFLLLSVWLFFASICCDGMLSCTSGEYLPAPLSCGFETTCADGSSKEFCGSCDFENSSCGWTNGSESTFYWERQMANFTSVPGQDHTTGSAWGYMMHVDGAVGSGFSNKANLEYVVESQFGLGCQISFWYYIHDRDQSPISSTDLRVRLVRGALVTDILEIKKVTSTWEHGTAFIGNQPPGYTVQISYSPMFMDNMEVMLDDVIFENCGLEDIPNGSENLTCDFETDMCSWYHDHSATAFWKRGNGKYEDISGNGYFMLVKAKSGVDPSLVARLKSFPQPGGQTICVSFFYLIFGNSIGSLKFIAKRAGEEETVVWMRSGTQGYKWRFADLTFKSDKPIEFIVEAVVGGDQGSIAIDDIVVSSSENGPCPPERECTFQGSLCGLQTRPDSDFSWNRITGTSQPANSSGPSTDHTLGTEQGYYLSAELWKHPPGSRGAMMTATMEPTPSNEECLMFWYYMEGAEAGELSVSLLTTDGFGNATKLWTRQGDQGKHWRHGRVTLSSPNVQYQVIFEAVAGDGPMRDVSIDDLTVLNGACPPTGFCDFEMDFCGWVNSPPPEIGVEWDWLTGESDGIFVPRQDHSTGSSLGHFALFATRDADKDKVAMLESEFMDSVDKACLEFWHYTSGWSHNNPSDITLTVFINDSTELRPVWSTNGFMNSSWILDRVDYSSPRPHQLILQANCSASDDGSFGLDDVHIISGMTCVEAGLTTTPNPPTTTTPSPFTDMDCTFEEGLCRWVQEVSDDADWSHSMGLEMDDSWSGPQYDHTAGNNEGSFLLLAGPGLKDTERALLSVPVLNLKSQSCVEFWFYVLGPSVSNLDLLVKTKSSHLLMWTRRGTQNPDWTNAKVTVDMNDALTIMFAGHRNLNSRGFIAIDDITVREGACGDDASECGFDSDSCGFENIVNPGAHWGREKGTKQHADHSYGTENGFYMTVLSSTSTQPEVAELLSPEFTSSQEMCVRFWYQLPTDSSNSLSVHTLISGDLGSALWRRSGSLSSGWEVAEVTVSSPANFYVVFKAYHIPGSNDSVRIDDFSVKDGACGPPVSCDFDSGQCTWVNIHTEDGHQWVLANGGSHGPPIDHTTQTPEGWFLLSSSQHQNQSSVAQVVSEWIQVKETSCFTLWYHMDDSNSGTLRVVIQESSSEERLIFAESSSGNQWSRFLYSLNTSQHFQLRVEAQSNSKGFIAIDDITLTSGFCKANDTGAGFGGCSFENGTCQWEDRGDGQFQWVRGRNATGITGPAVDNTLGTGEGWYMAVETHRGEQMSPASLQSPVSEQASSTCALHFHYNVYGDEAELRVLVREASRTTVLWWLTGNHGDEWQPGDVVIGRISSDFAIDFEAHRDLNSPGHIAIDDINFTNCSLPEPRPQCPGNAFTCNNDVCVHPDQVCDFSDDCGDRSDEADCDQHGVVERCDFERGLCFWEESDVDTSGAEWRDHRGHEAWPDLGPPRDHTQNSDAGHYVAPGAHLTAKGQTSEILSKTLLPSTNCTMRFFFFSADDAAGKLTALSRTLRSGDGDGELWLRETSHSFSWQRAQLTFTSSVSSKVVFNYELGEAPIGLVALDDISFTKECVFDPANNQLPGPSSSSTPATPSIAPTLSTSHPKPCQDGEFFCHLSAGNVCVPSSAQCDYRPDCPQGEDEDGCGPCTFERDQCDWTDPGAVWQRKSADNHTEPPSDHTTNTGHYMRANFTAGSTTLEATLQSPQLPPSSPFCQIQFHFHISAESAGSLRVLMQQAGGGEAILWSRSRSTVFHWTPEHLPLGRHEQPYKVWFSGLVNSSEGAASASKFLVAVDDISFLNCEKSYQPPALSSWSCNFEDDECAWMQGAEEELDWLSGSGPTETPNTGPAGDHTTGKGKFLYIESSHPSVKGSKALLKSPVLPSAGDKGYCLTLWYHMYGATVGSLKIILRTTNNLEKYLIWQKSGNQGDEWLRAQNHVTLQSDHQVMVEASVGGEAGDIAVDDITLTEGPCPNSELCDFEDDTCGWKQETTDDFDWVRQAGHTPNPSTGPESDHTTNTAAGHYYYLPSSPDDRAGQKALMSSPLYPADKGSCLQLWYHMYGRGMGTFNVYQQSEDEQMVLIFSQIGDQGRLWRFAQASLLPRDRPYRIVVEGVKSGPTNQGDMAFDDVQLTEAECPPHGFCDFESSLCGWTNLGEGVDQGDWLRGAGASPNPNTGPSVDHTTNSEHGHYVFVDSSVGEWGDMSLLISDVYLPSARGHCLRFWYHMYGDYVGTLRVYVNDREMSSGGDGEGFLHWVETGNQGNQWQEASVFIKHEQAFWIVFVYQRGMNIGGDVALDDISIVPTECYRDPAITPTKQNHGVTVGLAVGLTLLIGAIIAVSLFLLNRNRKFMPTIMTNEETTSAVFDVYGNSAESPQHEPHVNISFSSFVDDSSNSRNETEA